MRSLPAILLAALTAVAIAVSAVLMASHFGMRDWPTPPMPDTATRLITPTEAVGRASERDADDVVDAEVTADTRADTPRRAARRARGGAATRPEGARRRADGPENRRSGGRSGSRRSGGRSNDGRRPANPAGTETAPATTEPQPSEAAPAPTAPPTGSGGQVQARPDQSTLPETDPPVTLEPIVPVQPDSGDAAGDSADDRPGRKRGRAPAGDLLDQLP